MTLNAIQTGKLYILQDKIVFDEKIIYLDDPRDLKIEFAKLRQEWIKINEFHPIMLLEYWEDVKINKDEYFLVKYLTSGGHISYDLFWNKQDFMDMFKFAEDQ